MKRIAILTALILAAVSAFGQAARVDLPLLTAGPSVPISGGPLPQALWVANAAAYLCTHPSTTLAACQAAPITTYTDSTEGTTCPTATPLVQLPGNTCTASTGTAANVGFWYGGGVFDYWIVSSYGTYGPFSGNSSNSALPSSCGNPTGIPCGGTGATTAAGANLNITGVTQTGTLGTSSQVSTFPGTVAAGTAVVGIANGIYNASQFGIKCDGSSDDSTALNSIGTFVLAQAAGETVTVSFPSNATCVHASSITAWNVSNLHIKGNGSRLKFTGSGKQIYLHGAATEVDNLEISGFVLQGNSGSTDGVYQDNGIISRSTLDLINVQDQSHACFYLSNWELSTKLNLTCSADLASVMGVAQATQPQYGVIAGDPAGFETGFFANNRVVNLTIEGVGVIGLWCKHCTNQNHFFGTSEGTTSSSGTVGVGLQDYVTLNDNYSTSNTFSVDLEGNAVADANISGSSESFLSTVSLGTFNIQGGGGSLFGGEYQSIALSGSRLPWNLQNLYYNALQTSGTVSGYTCLGIGDVVTGVWNRVGGTAITQTLCTPLAPLAGPSFTNFMSSTPNTTTRSLTLAFANGVSNQKIDLYLPASAAFEGQLLVSLVDVYQDADNYGGLAKLIGVTELGGTIYGQASQYTTAFGLLASTYAIDDASWDATNGRLRVRISCLVAANCNTSPYLTVNVTAFSSTVSQIAAVSAIAQTSPYTTDATVYPTPAVSFSGAVIATGGVDVGALASPISVIPSTALGYQGPAAGYVQLALSGTTGTITGTALSASCDSGTATVTGAVVGHPVAVSSTTGADVGGAFNLRASVTASGTVTVYICGIGTPASLAYNVTIF